MQNIISGSQVKDYEKFLLDLLHEKQVTTVLDLACGTGDISVRLLEQGFKVVLHFPVPFKYFLWLI